MFGYRGNHEKMEMSSQLFVNSPVRTNVKGFFSVSSLLLNYSTFTIENLSISYFYSRHRITVAAKKCFVKEKNGNF